MIFGNGAIVCVCVCEFQRVENHLSNARKTQKSLKTATEVKGKHAHYSNACVKLFEMAERTKEIKMHLVILLFDSNITGHFPFVHLL